MYFQQSGHCKRPYGVGEEARLSKPEQRTPNDAQIPVSFILFLHHNCQQRLFKGVELIVTMSFGFSVGGFVAAADLIAQVVSALREAGGSASQHQHITSKLGYLDRALRDVNRLEPAEGLETTLEAIKTTALTCQLPLLEFLDNIRRYDDSLGPGQSSGVMRDVFLKMKWRVSKKLEAAMKLEAEIVAYLGAINLLLSLYKVYALSQLLGHFTIEEQD